MKNFLAPKTNYIWKVNFIMNEMTDAQKKECNYKGYINYSCNLDCQKCKLSYEYVLAFYAGYKEGYKTGRNTFKPIDIGDK